MLASLISRSFLSASALLSLALLPQNGAAQVSTLCNPLENAACPNDPALGTSYTFTFNSTPSASAWEQTVLGTNFDPDDFATFEIAKKGDAPTIRTAFYIFFGRTEIWMQAAPGQGICSSVMFLSDDLDEIDWEILGGNKTDAENNFYGKGIIIDTNALYYPVNGGTTDGFHNYTTLWTNTSLEWYIDGALVRTLLPEDAKHGSTSIFPQTPVRLSMGIWAAGDSDEAPGTIKWAGGVTDYSKGPFKMHVRSVEITDFMGGDGTNTSLSVKEYSYNANQTGFWQSIEMIEGNSTVKTALNAVPSESLAEKWKNLPAATKIAIYAVAAGVGAVSIAAGVFLCWRQRRRGVAIAALEAKRFDDDRLELEGYRQKGINSNGLQSGGADYNAKMDAMSIASSEASSTPKRSKMADATGAGVAASFGAARTASTRTSRSVGLSGGFADNSGNDVPLSPGLPPNPFSASAHHEQAPLNDHGFRMSVASTGPPAALAGSEVRRMASPGPLPAPQPVRIKPDVDHLTGLSSPPVLAGFDFGMRARDRVSGSAGEEDGDAGGTPNHGGAHGQ